MVAAYDIMHFSGQAEEAREGGRDHAAELADLQQDAGLPLEELLAQYGYVVPNDAPRPAPGRTRRGDAGIGEHPSASDATTNIGDVMDAAPAPGRRRQPRSADSKSAAAQRPPAGSGSQHAGPAVDQSRFNAAEATGNTPAQPGSTRTSALQDDPVPATSDRTGRSQQVEKPADVEKAMLPDSAQPAGASMRKSTASLAGATAEQTEALPQQEVELGQGSEEAGGEVMFDSGSEGGTGTSSSSSDEDMGGSEEEADDEGTLEEEERLAEQEGGTSKVTSHRQACTPAMSISSPV